MGGPCVSIVILNWNGWEDTINCLESVFDLESPRRKVVVVDNGSSDGSVDALRTWAKTRANACSIDGELPFAEYDRCTAENGGEPRKEIQLDALTGSRTPLVLIRNEENIGYARGNNVGINYVLRSNRSDYILVLNNDAILERRSLEILVQGLSKFPSAGVVGPNMVDYFDGANRQWPVTKELNFAAIIFVYTGLSRWFRNTAVYQRNFYLGNEERKVYAIRGSCMLFRREALEAIGGFDEGTFLYWEEFIVADRLATCGYETYFIPASRVPHKVGASTAKLGARKFIENVRSENYYFSEYRDFSRLQLLALKSVRGAAYLARSFVNKDYRDRWRDFLSALLGTVTPSQRSGSKRKAI